jgi:phenylalanyl-tRNA synthetase beta chain
VTPAQARAGLAKRVLAARGFMEAVTYSFMSSANAAPFEDGRPSVRLVNPISAELDVMRPSILPNLIDAALRNAQRGIADAALFEVGPQYADASAEGQTLVAAGIRRGKSGPRHWARPARDVDAFHAKADALALLAACGIVADAVATDAKAPSWYHPGRSGALRLGPTALGYFGELHPRLSRRFDHKEATVAFEIFLDRVKLPRDKGTRRPLLKASPFQPVERDFAFVVDESVPADKLLRAVKLADRALIASVGLFDVYVGPGVPAGKKSVAIAVTLQAGDRTMTEAEIDAAAQAIVAAVAKATGASLRS